MRNSWLLWAGASAVFAALTAILAKLGVENVNSNLATAVRTAVVLVFAWVIVFATGSGSGLRSLGARSWMFLALSGAATGLSWLCYFRALQLGQASQVAPIDKLSVVFTLALAALFLGEKLTWHEWLGGGLIVAGAVVIALRP
jgi:bacterial/archaeal transporter family protein